MGYEDGVKRRIAAVKELRGKYPGIGPFRDDVSEARLAALREARGMVVGIAPAIQGDHFFNGMRAMHKNVIGIVDALIAKEEGR